MADLPITSRPQVAIFGSAGAGSRIVVAYRPDNSGDDIRTTLERAIDILVERGPRQTLQISLGNPETTTPIKSKRRAKKDKKLSYLH